MGRPGNKKQDRRAVVTHDVARFRDLLARFQPILARRKPTASLDEFDAEAEGLIGEVFGETSELRETYEYAAMGEAAALLNMQEEAQEGGAQDTYRESLQQRKQALESCVVALQTGGTRPPNSRVVASMSDDVACLSVIVLLLSWYSASMLLRSLWPAKICASMLSSSVSN